MKKTLFFALALAISILAFTSCQNDKNDPDVTKPIDDITINPEDWHTVPQSGCTIELDDISLTVPANTFSEDTKLSVTKLKSGNYYGGYEASNFYYITVPAQVNRSITVNLTPNKEGANVQYAARAPFHRKSTNEDVVGDIELECKYDDNGECTILLPTSENDTEDPNLWIIVGLVEDNSSTPSSKGAAMRKMTDLTETPAGQVKNVKWHFAMDTWLWLKLTDSEGTKIKNLMNKLNPIVEDAITKIHDLGFVLDEERNIPICFIRDEKHPDAFGFFCQGFWSDKTSTVELNLSTLEKSDDPNVWGRTCIHEILHYFQANYDKRCPEKKYFGGEEDILNEAAAVWVEQFMNDGQLDAKFVGGHVSEFLQGYSIYENGNKPSEQGYGMSTLLYYLTNPMSGMAEVGITKNSIVELFQAWKDNPDYRGSSYLPLTKWFSNHQSTFMSYDYDKFLLAALSGKVFDLVEGGKADLSGLDGRGNVTSFNKDRTHTYPKRTCLGLGCAIDKGTVHLRENFEGKEIIIQQEEPDMATYLFIGTSDNKCDYFKQPATLDNPLVIAGEEIDAMLKGSEKTTFYFVTLNTKYSVKKDFKVTCTVQDAAPKPTLPKISSINFDAFLTMGTAEKKAVVDFIVDFDTKNGDSINVSSTSTGYAVKATNKSGNKRSIYFEVNTREADPVMTKMTVTYNKPENYDVSLSLTNLPRIYKYYDLIYKFEADASENTFHLSDFSYEGTWGSFNTIVPGESAKATVKVYFDN